MGNVLNLVPFRPDPLGVTVQELLGHSKLEAAQICTHVMQKPGLGVRSPLDGRGAVVRSDVRTVRRWSNAAWGRLCLRCRPVKLDLRGEATRPTTGRSDRRPRGPVGRGPGRGVAGLRLCKRSWACGQRGWKGQPLGGLIGEGTSPVSTIRFVWRRGSGTGMAEIKARV
jgi:hypothetical protein